MWWEFINFQLAKWLSCWSMRLGPHTVTDAIRLDIRTSSKWLPCQKALIPHKMHKELKKINSATLEMKINFTALNCFSCQKSHISIISLWSAESNLFFLPKFKEDDHKLHSNHRSCPTSSPENSCVKVQPTNVAWQSVTVWQCIKLSRDMTPHCQVTWHLSHWHQIPCL